MADRFFKLVRNISLQALFVTLLFSSGCADSQKALQQSGEKFSESDSSVFRNEISKFKLNNGDTLIDVGCGYNDELIFCFYPDMFFILEDIGKRYLKENNYAFTDGKPVLFGNTAEDSALNFLPF